MKWKNAPNFLFLLALPVLCLLGSLHQRHGHGLAANSADDQATYWTSSAAQRSQQDAIRQAVFQYQFAEYCRVVPTAQRPALFFISLPGGHEQRCNDPSAALIQALSQNVTPVKRGSCAVSLRPEETARYSSDLQPVVRDRSTGRDGVQFSLSDIRWVSPRQAEVDCNYYQTCQQMGGSSFLVVRHLDGWRVESKMDGWGAEASGVDSLSDALG